MNKSLFMFKIYILAFILSTLYIAINIILKTEPSITETIISNTVCFISLIKIMFSVSEVK